MNTYKLYERLKEDYNIACYEKINLIVPDFRLGYVGYQGEKECRMYNIEESGAIFYPRYFDPKFVIRKLIFWPFLLDYPQVQKNELVAYVLDPVLKRVCELHTKDHIASFRKALIEIHNKNISKNYKILTENVPGVRLRTL